MCLVSSEKKTNLIKKSYDLLLVGRNLSCIFWFISENFELIQFLPRVPVLRGDLAKFWSDDPREVRRGRGNVKNSLLALATLQSWWDLRKGLLVRFIYANFHKNQRPRFLVLFSKKCIFTKILCESVSKTKAPFLQVCLSLCRHARAPRLLGFFTSRCGKKIYSKQTTYVLPLLACFAFSMLFAYVLFCLLLLIYTFFLFSFVFANS